MSKWIIATLLNNGSKPVVTASTSAVVADDRAWAQGAGLDHAVAIVDSFIGTVEVEFSAFIAPEAKAALWAALAEAVAAALR